MEEEKYFDYSRGLNAPYWIQEVKTAKGKVIWYFSTPMQLSFFIVFFIILVLMLTVCSPLMQVLNALTHFGLNKKGIYQGERVDIVEEIVFEKTKI